MNHLRIWPAIAALALAAPVAAQNQPLEFGMDGGFEYTFLEFAPNRSRLVLPFGSARLATGISPRVSLDGSFGFVRGSQGDQSASNIYLAPGVVVHFREYEAGQGRPYFGGRVSMNYVDAESGAFAAGDTQFGIGAMLGTKRPFADAGFFRFEAGLVYYLESDLRGSATAFTAGVGIGGVLGGG